LIKALFGSRHETNLRPQRPGEQRFGIEVLAIGVSHAEMKKSTSDGDDVAAMNTIANRNSERGKERVTRSQPVAMFDRDVEFTANLTSEDHAPVG
jgi:hypothetical protein